MQMKFQKMLLYYLDSKEKFTLPLGDWYISLLVKKNALQSLQRRRQASFQPPFTHQPPCYLYLVNLYSAQLQAKSPHFCVTPCINSNQVQLQVTSSPNKGNLSQRSGFVFFSHTKNVWRWSVQGLGYCQCQLSRLLTCCSTIHFHLWSKMGAQLPVITINSQWQKAR